MQRGQALLPETLRQTRQRWHVATFGDQLGPAFNDLRPFARNLAR